MKGMPEKYRKWLLKEKMSADVAEQSGVETCLAVEAASTSCGATRLNLKCAIQSFFRLTPH